MELTPAERVAVRRAVAAYRDARDKTTKGAFKGTTAEQILDDLHPTPERWAELASFVIGRCEDDG